MTEANIGQTVKKRNIGWRLWERLRRVISLRWRLTLLNGALVTVLGIGLCVFMYVRLQNYLYDSVRSRLHDYAVTQAFLTNGKDQGGGDHGGHSDQKWSRGIIGAVNQPRPILSDETDGRHLSTRFG